MKIKLSENSNNFQFKPLTVCPLPPKATKRTVLEGMQEFEEYKPVCNIKVGKQNVKIVGDPKHGYPYGRDILAVLYLIRKAFEQNNDGIIEFSDLKDYLDLFGIDKGGKGYKAAVNTFKRIFYSTWFWEDSRSGFEQSVSFRIIKSWNVWFDENQDAVNPMFESYIQLTEEFWSIAKRYKIPYDLEAVKKLKHQPVSLNLYLFLIYRTHTNWLNEKQEIFIPFFGDNGLKAQLSSTIKRNDHFKEKILKWIEDINAVWLDAPFFVKSGDLMKTQGKKKKVLDGLFIHVKRASQLHVPPHWDKQKRIAIETSKRNNLKVIEDSAHRDNKCFTCGGQLVLIEGKVNYDGTKRENYYRCFPCSINYYKHQFPEIYT